MFYLVGAPAFPSKNNIINLATDYKKNSSWLQILNDKKQITEKKSIMSACNLSYRLKRSGPKGEKVGDFIENQHIQIDYKQWAMCPPAST